MLEQESYTRSITYRWRRLFWNIYFLTTNTPDDWHWHLWRFYWLPPIKPGHQVSYTRK